MPSRILSDREVEQLASWPAEVARSDLAAFFTLSVEPPVGAVLPLPAGGG